MGRTTPGAGKGATDLACRSLAPLFAGAIDAVRQTLAHREQDAIPHLVGESLAEASNGLGARVLAMGERQDIVVVFGDDDMSGSVRRKAGTLLLDLRDFDCQSVRVEIVRDRRRKRCTSFALSCIYR